MGIVVVGTVFVDIKGFPYDVYNPTGRNAGTVEAYYRESGTSVSGSKLKALGWTWAIYRRELGLPLMASAVHFIKYAFKGLSKRLK